EEFLEALRAAEIVTKPSSLLYVQALKFLETKATPPGARERRRERRVRRAIRKARCKGKGDPRSRRSPQDPCPRPTTRAERRTPSAPSASSTPSPASCRDAATARAAT